MLAIETKLSGCFIIEPKVFEDERGYFFESFNQRAFNNAIKQDVRFVQDNESYSSKGVLRGLHFQKGDYAQAKLVRVLQGEVLDISVDIRKNSPTFGQHVAVTLSESNKKQFYIPRGFAHGFVVLSHTAKFLYKCDNFYNKNAESGIIYNDETFNIDWVLPENNLLISSKDMALPQFAELSL